MDLSLGSLVDEIAHPFGGFAFVDPIKRRDALPKRERVEYEDGQAERVECAQEVVGSASGNVVGALVTTADATDADEGAVSNSSSAGKRKWHTSVRSVQLPNWMDLDRDSLPHGGRHAVALVDVARQGASKPVSLPRILDEFGAVGETNVQLRTARAPDDESFDALLDGYRE